MEDVMPDPQTPRRARTRARILAGAEPLLREHGLRKVTVEDLCAAAGVSRRTFYQHFEGREELASEVIGIIVKDITGPLIENLQSRRPAAELIPKHFQLVAKLAYSRVSARFFADVDAELPEASRLIAEARGRVIDGLVAVIHRGQREGSIEPGFKPESIGKILNAILEDSLSAAFALSNDLSLAEICETLSPLFMNGLFVAKTTPAADRRRTRRKR
jgi:AcrR family transcriptional regulator